ncbi:unnamed protein product [Mucor hiemalis]
MKKNKLESCEDCVNSINDFTENRGEHQSDYFSSNLKHPIDNFIYENNTEMPLATFDLDRIMMKYGDNPGILQLILSSKVEEDRRRTEEAKLKQRELEYLLSHKEHSCLTSKCSKEKTVSINKRKYTNVNERNSTSNSEGGSSHLLPTTSRINEVERDDFAKRQMGYQHEKTQVLCLPSQPQYHKNDDCLSSSFSSSCLSPKVYEETEVHTENLGVHQHQFLHTSSVISPLKLTSSSPSNSTPHLQDPDYSASRQTRLDLSSQLPYRSSSSTGKFKVNDNSPPNTLPPINTSLMSLDQLRTDIQNKPLAIQCKSSTNITSIPLKHNRTNRLHTLPTLDSFEASIMETLSFDNTSDNSSVIEDNICSNKSESRSNLSGDKVIEKNQADYTSKGKINKADAVGRSDIIDAYQNTNLTNSLRKDVDNSEKLLLPPNPLHKSPNLMQSTSRPRRRRREMQPITMIIETKDFPYNDDYVWKNNGNTIHKRSGQKSIYYKCSNSNAVCNQSKVNSLVLIVAIIFI